MALMPDDTTSPVTAEDLRERAAAALHGTYPADWHGASAEECTTCQTRARVIVAALAGDPGDLPARMAAELSRHYILTGATVTPEGRGCACGQWAGGDWNAHLADAALSVRWEDHAATVARLAEAEARADRAEGQVSALRDHGTRWEAEKARADKVEAELAETQNEVRDSRLLLWDSVADVVRRAESAEAERDALKAAIERVRVAATTGRRTSIGRVYDYVPAADVLAALDAPEYPENVTTPAWETA